MNTQLLRKIQNVVLADPQVVDMDKWTCGTTACIGGWAMRLKDFIDDKSKITAKGAKIANRLADYYEDDEKVTPGEKLGSCGVDEKELAMEALDLDYDQAENLFYVESWPEPFTYLYRNSPRKQRGHIVASRIEHFIQNNE